MTLRHLLGLVKAFRGRFLALGLQVGIPVALVVGTIDFAVGLERDPPGVGFVLGLGALVVMIDFALTFVTPALAYTTRSASDALLIGRWMIRETWPRCMFYVFCPPLALNLAIIFAPMPDGPIAVAVGIVMVPIGLVAKGAIAAFYLRVHGSRGEDGAAYAPVERGQPIDGRSGSVA